MCYFLPVVNIKYGINSHVANLVNIKDLISSTIPPPPTSYSSGKGKGNSAKQDTRTLQNSSGKGIPLPQLPIGSIPEQDTRTLQNAKGKGNSAIYQSVPDEDFCMQY